MVAAMSVLYLNEESAQRFAPTPGNAVSLAGQALRAIARGDVDLGHCVLRPPDASAFGSLAAVVRDPARAGMKWVAESASGGVTGTILLSDNETGFLTAVVSATFLTALRTAAVSGACIHALGAQGPVGLVGTGLQARSHLRVFEALGRHEVHIAYRRRESGDAIVAWARDHLPALQITAVDNVRAAVEGMPIVVTAITYGSLARVDPRWLRRDALLLPVDLAHCISAEVAETADVIAADDPANYEHMRANGSLPGYPPVQMASGAALDAERPSGCVLIQNLGNAVTDVLLAAATRDAATAAGGGVSLER